MHKFDEIIDKFLDIFFGKDKTKLILILIVLLGLILRITAAINLSMAGDDPHFAVQAINFLNSGKLETYDQAAPLWFSITSIFYNLFGISQLTSRLSAIIFSTFSIFLIFLISKKFFNNSRVGLFAAFLLSISPYSIKYMLAEHDQTALFFVLFSVYLFYIALEKDSSKYFLISGLFMGLGVMTKLYVFLFAPPLYLFAFYNKYKLKKKWIDKKLFKQLLIFAVAMFFFFLPALTHNYLLYQEKGFMDFPFTKAFGFGIAKAASYYSWDAGWKNGMDLRGFFLGNPKYLPGSPPLIWMSLKFLIDTDWVVSILALIGLITLVFIKKERKVAVLLALLFIIPWIMLGSSIVMAKHFIFMLLFAIPVAAFALNEIFIKTKKYFMFIIILIILFQLIFMGFKTPNLIAHTYEKSSIGQLMEYKQNKIPADAVVLIDGRIYRGILSWALNDRYYLESSYLNQLMEAQNQLSGEPIYTNAYFIECIPDDCGWGTIKDQPDFNKTMEDLVDSFKNISSEEIVIKDYASERYLLPFYKSGNGESYFKIYKTQLLLKPQSFDLIKSTHSFFMYPIGYDKTIAPIFDDFKVEGTFDNLLYKNARGIIYFGIVLAFLSLLYLFYLIIIDKPAVEAQNN